LPVGPALVYGGMFALIIGSFLPWLSLFGTSVGGVQTDGLITLVLGIVAGPPGFLSVRGVLWASLTLVATAGVAGFVVIFDVIRIAASPASIGVGLPLCGLATAALLGGAMHSMRSSALHSAAR
jgi:hypothetical protein